MEIKNQVLVERLNIVANNLGMDNEQLISQLLVSEELILPTLQHIEDVIATELVTRSVNQLANVRALRSQVLNIHADGMDSSDRAIAFAKGASEIAEEFITVNGAELLRDQLFFAEKRDFISTDVQLDETIKELLEAQCVELNISLSEMINNLLIVSSNIPLALLRIEKLFSQDLVVNYIASQSEIEALRFEINGLHAELKNNREQALKISEAATEHGFNSVFKKSTLED